MMSKIEGLARFIASDVASDWDKMGEAQRDYWRRIAGRVVVYQHREQAAQAELGTFLEEEAA